MQLRTNDLSTAIGIITIIRYTPPPPTMWSPTLQREAVNNDELLLRPGMTATATITVQSIPHALLVSNHALRFLPSTNNTDSNSTSFLPGPPNSSQSANAESSAALNNPRVWIVREGRPSPVSVTVGATDGKLTEIRSGQVKPGTP